MDRFEVLEGQRLRVGGKVGGLAGAATLGADRGRELGYHP